VPPTRGRIAFIGTYVPRKCGIATFTHDLIDAIIECASGATCAVVRVAADETVTAVAHGATSAACQPRMERVFIFRAW
jgi:hypothetical protein